MKSLHTLDQVFQAIGSSIPDGTEEGQIQMQLLQRLNTLLFNDRGRCSITAQQAADLSVVIALAAKGHLEHEEDLEAHALDFARQIKALAETEKA